MTRQEMELLDNKIVTEEQFEEIELHEDVESINNCGNSSVHTSKCFYQVNFIDGDEILIYY